MRSSELKWAAVSGGFNYVALVIVIGLWYPGGLSGDDFELHLRWFSFLFAAWLLVGYVFSLYEERLHARQDRFLRNLMSGWIVAMVSGAIFFYAQPSLLLTPRRFLLAVTSLSFFLFWLATFCFTHWRKISGADVYFLGGDTTPESWLVSSLIPGQKFRGSIAEAENLSKLRYGDIVVADTDYQFNPEQNKFFLQAKRKGVRFVKSPDWREAAERKVVFSALGDFWLLEFGGARRKLYDRLKRIIDILVALLGLVFLAVLYLPIALGIKLSSGGPVLFTQGRVGQEGARIFRIYKFRTMRENPGGVWTSEQDARIFPFGRFLRRWSLDELPQFWNIARGDMSLVGPRPEQAVIVEQLSLEIPLYDERHAVKPGLTGWAQLHVYAATLSETKLKLEYDLYYVKHRGFWFDMEIILKTLAYLIFRQQR